ncbi:hypothetical protein [Treponema endosymbiont of Eucomonympha sp.]|uniref:hypothetical protein n=1 Tax=Treponema endosymbiont of Eucomonympha sp. TaxID=1580831 RepID=UPI00139685CB|nr:hypothetical protein [Treponema endosymbiont of Eucomonympha sp.]
MCVVSANRYGIYARVSGARVKRIRGTAVRCAKLTVFFVVAIHIRYFFFNPPSSPHYLIGRGIKLQEIKRAKTDSERVTACEPPARCATEVAHLPTIASLRTGDVLKTLVADTNRTKKLRPFRASVWCGK